MACLFPPRMTVRMRKPELVSPKTPTPRETKPLSDVDDQASLRYQMPLVWFYKSKAAAGSNKPQPGSDVTDDPAELIREGLAKALVFYYPLAGRLVEGPKKKLSVDCTGEGVLFVRAEANLSLQKLGRFVQSPSPYLEKLLYHVPGSDYITGAPLLLLQVTRFTCGGFALGVRLNHTMLDGYGIFLFLKAVCELATGALAPSVLPVWERQLLTAAADSSETAAAEDTMYGSSVTVATSNKKQFKLLDIERWASFALDFDKVAAQPRFFFYPAILRPILLHRSFTLTPQDIQALKDRVLEEGLGKCSTFEVISACLWKCRTVGLQPDPNATVTITFPTDIRGRSSTTGLTIPRGYYGNAIVMLSAAANAKMLCESPLSYAIQLIRESKEKLNGDYVKSAIDFLVVNERRRLPIERNLLISDLSKIGMEKLDFGWGNAIYAGTATAAYGATFLERPKSSASVEGGVLVPIALPHVSMLIFSREFKKMAMKSSSNTPVLRPGPYTRL
ncbi:unnamed protein product [Cuscuta epithymum]|uniref:Uncharacterized protein n=1 Tax=Cuscuta epithymum TaxID=186058 RepID=A0AAV0GD42_9ASTE|nr:unnamed protein product [Cuscuta epithymum]